MEKRNETKKTSFLIVKYLRKWLADTKAQNASNSPIFCDPLNKYLAVSPVQICNPTLLVQILAFKEAKEFLLSGELDQDLVMNLNSFPKKYLDIMIAQVGNLTFNKRPIFQTRLTLRENLMFERLIDRLLENCSDNSQMLDLLKTGKKRIETMMPIVESKRAAVLNIMIKEQLDTFSQLIEAHPELFNEEHLGEVFYLISLRRGDLSFFSIPEQFRSQKIYLAAVQQNGWHLEFIPTALRTKAICRAAVQQNGRAVQFVLPELKTAEICLAAVQQNGLALDYVPAALRTEAICLAAVQQNGWALDYVPAALKTEAICLVAVDATIKACVNTASTVCAKVFGSIYVYLRNFKSWLREPQSV